MKTYKNTYDLNHLQHKLLVKCMKHNMSTHETLNELKFQRDLCKKLMAYSDEVFARKVFKKSVMVTCSYGGSYGTSRDDVLENLRAVESKFLRNASPEEVSMFCQMVFWSLESAVPCAMNFMNYFRKLLSFALKYKESIYFKHPLTQFPVHLKVKKVESSTFNFRVHGKQKSVRLNKTLNETNKRKTTSSSIPGITHSSDAAILTCLKQLLGDTPMAFIHDSIGIHPNNIKTSKNAIQDVLKLFSDIDIFTEIKNDVLEGIPEDQIPEELKTVPHEGTWKDYNTNIENAEYAFA